MIITSLLKLTLKQGFSGRYGLDLPRNCIVAPCHLRVRTQCEMCVAISLLKADAPQQRPNIAGHRGCCPIRVATFNVTAWKGQSSTILSEPGERLLLLSQIGVAAGQLKRLSIAALFLLQQIVKIATEDAFQSFSRKIRFHPGDLVSSGTTDFQLTLRGRRTFFAHPSFPGKN